MLRHGANMDTIRRKRSLDRRRSLQPRDYLVNPFLFGIDPQAEMVHPPNGDTESFEIARVLHRCFAARQHSSQHISGAELGRRFGFSKQSWSTIAQGHRWPGHTVLAGLLAALEPQLATSPNHDRSHHQK